MVIGGFGIFAHLGRAFGRDRRGNVAMMWALMGAVLLGLVGMSVDFTRAQMIRSQLQNAADGAALAAARMTQGTTMTARTAAARGYFDSEAGASAANATFNLVDIGNNGYRVDVTAPMDMSLARLVSNQPWTIAVSSDAVRGGVNVEVALVLDTTGSMSGTKISTLRTAATDLVNTVVLDSQTPYYSKLALVSYSVGVNAGSYAASVRGAIPAGHSISGASWSTGNAMTVSGASKTNPVVVTANAHGFSSGQYVYLSGIRGMTQINNQYFRVGTVTTNTFQLLNPTTGANINGTGYSTWSSGGTQRATRCQTSACEVVVTSNGHGFSNNDRVFITGVSGMTQINNTTGSGSGTTWTVASASSNTFVLSGSVGPTYSAYSSGGTAYCTTYGCQYYRFTNASGTTNVFQVSTCTTERTGGNAYTDAAPSTSLLSLNYPSTASNGACPSNTILPLTSDRTTINSRISSLSASGYTAGQVGAAWGWYMLAPNFGYLWPSSSVPAAYHAPETLKIMVLMTDGAFNTSYCHGVIAQDTSGAGNNVDHINCNATNGDPLVQARNLCTAMKSQGIIVYTVGFQMQGESQASRDMMTQCATDSSHAYMADDNAALTEAFRQIGQSISQLRLTH